MKIAVRNRCSDFSSYRAARTKSLFNAETGCNFDLDVDLPIDDDDWKLGVVVGPSGSGKTSIGKLIWGESVVCDPRAGWPTDAPIVDAIAPGGDYNAVTGALASVGLGNVPAWLRPFYALSNGEQFRASMARIIGLAAALRRDRCWRQVSACLYGGNKKRSGKSIARSAGKRSCAGYGGHFRAVQGFRYHGHGCTEARPSCSSKPSCHDDGGPRS